MLVDQILQDIAPTPESRNGSCLIVESDVSDKAANNDIILQLYVLPSDSANRFVDRQNKRLQQALSEVLSNVVLVDKAAWEGDIPAFLQAEPFDRWSFPQEGSLFYCFNTVSSPEPSPRAIREKYAREALEDLLEPDRLSGLKTQLYAYQRRSAGAMLQREASPSLDIDPRFEARRSPDCTLYFYNAWDVTFSKEPPLLENSRSGILAESMGLGKTVIVLALVLA